MNQKKSLLLATVATASLVGTAVKADVNQPITLPLAEENGQETTVTEAQVSAAQSKASEATKAAETATKAVEEQKVVVAEAKASEQAAAATEAQATQAVATATTEASTAQSAAETAKTAVATAESQVTTAQAAVTQASQSQGSTETVTQVVATHDTAADQEHKAADSTYSDTIFSGETVTQTVELTDEQKAAYDAGDFVPYTPDNTKVSQYAAQYITELRQLNGIESEPIEISADVVAYATARAEEQLANGVMSHNTQLKDRRQTGENAAETSAKSYNKTYSLLPDVASDQEMAYRLVLGWFNEYGNVREHDGYDGKYGHRNAMLFTNNSTVGVGVAFSDTPSIDDSGVKLYDGFAALNWFIKDGYRTFGNPAEKGVTYQENADGTTTQLLNGKPLVFLPKYEFQYTYTKVVNASTALADAQATLAAKQVALKAAQTTAESTQAEADKKAAALATAQAELAAAKQVHAEKVAALDAAVSQLQSLESDAAAAKSAQAAAVQSYHDVLKVKLSADLANKKVNILLSGKDAVAVYNAAGELVDYQAVEKPKADEPKVEEPKVEEPKAEEPKAEEPKVQVSMKQAPTYQAPATPMAYGQEKVSATKAPSASKTAEQSYSRAERAQSLPKTNSQTSLLSLLGLTLASLIIPLRKKEN